MRETYHHRYKLGIKLSGLLAGLLLAWLSSAYAEQLPIKQYTTADGLARDDISRIVRDGRGYLWFCTGEGLSRFDGYQFTTYTVKDGLPHRSVLDLLETRDGQYWVATADGLCRLNPTTVDPAHKFEVYRPERADAKTSYFRRLVEDRAGNIWCGTYGGLFRLTRDGGRWRLAPVDLAVPESAGEPLQVRALLEDRRGDLWIGTHLALFRRRPAGRFECYTDRHGLKGLSELTDLAQDRAGRLWLATRWYGLHLLVSEPVPDRPVVAHTYRVTGAPFPDTFLSLFQAADGRLWAGRHQELVEILPADDPRGTTFRRYTAANGLAGMNIWTMNEDRDGNLWLGSETRGVTKIARHGFTIYSETDGLPSGIFAVVPNRDGELVGAVFSDPNTHLLGWFDGKRFVWLWPAFPPAITQFGWGPARIQQDRQGDWWFGTDQGLARFPKTQAFAQLQHTRPKTIYTTRDGLATDHIFTLHEDARGDLWIAYNGTPPGGLTRWVRADETFHRYSLTQDTPFLRDNFINAFGEDRSGQVWMGLWHGGLVRHRAGRFTRFTAEDGVPAGMITQIYRDRAGRLWVASGSGGVARIDDPTADRPRFVSYNRARGLASDTVNSITEDRWGRIYLATGRGINRIDTDTGQIKQYTTADGLPENTVEGSFRDRHDALWFATRKGLARLDPELDRPAPPPTILISGVRIAGENWSVSSLGQEEVTGIEVPAHQNQVQIDFVGIHYATGETLFYQYRLEGSGQGWESTEQRTMNLAGLSPGAYRFLVRAVSTDGLASPRSAIVSFTILPPVWRRWWFLTLAGLGLSALVYVLYRYRLAQVIKLERVRMRIATDLHDDIGSYLSAMALLGDAVRQRIRDAEPGTREMAGEIAETARRLADAMSDIVWSIDPRRDDLRNLLVRLRQYAARVFAAQGIDYTIQTPPEGEDLKLTPEQRRHLYLICKEAITNIVRHAGARSVTITVTHADHHLTAEIRDDGRGFARPEAGESPEPPSGNGLRNMRARAEQLGGQLSVESAPGRGTGVRLSVPLR